MQWVRLSVSSPNGLQSTSRSVVLKKVPQHLTGLLQPDLHKQHYWWLFIHCGNVVLTSSSHPVDDKVVIHMRGEEV